MQGVQTMTTITVGSDPEFIFVQKDENGTPIPASHFFRSCTAPVGTDGCSSTGELRPGAHPDAFAMTEQIRKLLRKVYVMARNNHIIVVGNGLRQQPVGGHIHFGSRDWTNDRLYQRNREAVQTMIRTLDVPLLLFSTLDHKRTIGTRRTGYGKMGAYELKSYGFEYRSPSAIWLCDPRACTGIVATYHAIIAEVVEDGSASARIMSLAHKVWNEYDLAYEDADREEIDVILPDLLAVVRATRLYTEDWHGYKAAIDTVLKLVEDKKTLPNIIDFDAWGVAKPIRTRVKKYDLFAPNTGDAHVADIVAEAGNARITDETERVRVIGLRNDNPDWHSDIVIGNGFTLEERRRIDVAGGSHYVASDILGTRTIGFKMSARINDRARCVAVLRAIAHRGE